jgi:hypothetical protein
MASITINVPCKSALAGHEAKSRRASAEASEVEESGMNIDIYVAGYLGEVLYRSIANPGGLKTTKISGGTFHPLF